ncbi:interleukin-22 [Suncus etruscus]|uniref:interleukin-22 n=1 Tax=Suncus etruscus TaxID=109475 RepID=UPI00210FDB49|nr:interleukin-22 [Suncus etruscus]
MATLQRPANSFLKGVMTASCLLLIALWVQGGAAWPIGPHCRLDKSDLPSAQVTNHTFRLAEEASLADNNTDVRLFGRHQLFRGVNATDYCYVMKQVLNFTVEEVLLLHSHRYQPYMDTVLSYLIRINHKLNHCYIERDDQNIQRNVQELKDTVRELGESGEIKVIGELNLLRGLLVTKCF